MNFKNLKVPVENNLDEIVVELERLGYKLNGWLKNRIIRSVKTNHFGLYSGDFFDVDIIQGELTTLDELKEM